MIHKEKVKSKGMHLITVCDVSTPEAKKLENRIESLVSHRSFLLRTFSGENLERELLKHWKNYNKLVAKLHSRFMKRQILVPNITTTAGRTVLARRLSGNTTYSGSINYTALGTSNTAPTVGDTQLGTETYRKALSSGTYLNNVAYIETFFSASEVNGTFQEYANFIDGSGSANSGQMFNRFTQTVSKSATETLNVQSVVTFSDV